MFAPSILKTPSFYQDRLGTNIGKAALKKETAACSHSTFEDVTQVLSEGVPGNGTEEEENAAVSLAVDVVHSFF